MRKTGLQTGAESGLPYGYFADNYFQLFPTFIQVHSRIRETYPASHNANPLVRKHSPSYQTLLKNSLEQATRRHRSQEAISQDDQAPLPS